MKKILSIILIVCISLSILIISLELQVFNINSYRDSYYKYDLGDRTLKEEDEFLNISRDIIEYLKNQGSISLMEKHFNEREVSHMVDVQGLFKLARIIKYISLIIVATIIFYMFIVENMKYLLGKIYKGLSFNYIIVLLFVFMINLDFNKYFIYFHKIFFTNDLWLLNPETDLLIQMMPESFFVDMIIKIGVGYILGVVLIQIISFLLKKYNFNDKSE